MTKQWILTRITKDKKAFLIGNPSTSVQAVQALKAESKQQYPNQVLVVREYEAFKQTPVPKKYL